MTRIKASVNGYADWLRGQLGAEVVEADLKEKHRMMREGAFPFLRATYWRWCETAAEVLAECGELPEVLAVGDTHLENFGTWRDGEGRLVWGVNDFDDAAVMPYVFDLMRLGVSALLSTRIPPPAREICAALWTGYQDGLASPGPVILERDYRWLREAILLPEKDRAKWWNKFMRADGPVPKRFRAALSAAMPERRLPIVLFHRQAGAGSLGKPRIVGRAEWHGGPVIREAKAVLAPAWHVFRGRRGGQIQAARIAFGRYRAPDPHYHLVDGMIARRLSPNSRKIDAAAAGSILLAPGMLALMARDIGSCHAGDTARIAAVRADAAGRDARWLRDLVRVAAKAVERDFRDFR